jgi:signal transduction histidine kinase
MASRVEKSISTPDEYATEKPDPVTVAGSSAKEEIKILLLEDNDRDAGLILHALRTSTLRFRLTRVETRAAFTMHLTRSPPDLILSDYSLPTFDGFAALRIAHKLNPDMPFIFVTGTLGEEMAIDTLKKGATDYVLKHRLIRLVPAVNRALLEARQRGQRRRAEEKLRKSHEQLRTLSLYLEYVREEERIRIAREVHDVLGQALTGLKLQLTWMMSRLPRKPRSLLVKARAMSGQIDDTIDTVRRIATDLRPGVLDNAGLLAAIEWQANQFQRRTGIRCRVSANIKDSLWDQDLNTAFFRIFQEALTNIVRHAGATEVKVTLTRKADDLILRIRDNGSGISEAEAQNTKSFGLLGMRERAGLLGGEVRVRGRPGQGTVVSVLIPQPNRRQKKNSSP